MRATEKNPQIQGL